MAEVTCCDAGFEWHEAGCGLCADVGNKRLEDVREIARQVEAAGRHAEAAVDLASQKVAAPEERVFTFRTLAPLRTMLPRGLSEIDRTLHNIDIITPF